MDSWCRCPRTGWKITWPCRVPAAPSGATWVRSSFASAWYDVKPGKWTSFPQAVDLQDGEVVIFSWIVYESRASRDEINDKVMKDPRMKEYTDPENLPFDGKRMVYGGYEMKIDL